MKNVKAFLGEKRNSGIMPTFSELVEKTKDYAFISFDIFDTLLKRNVNNPSDIFDIIQFKIGNKETQFKKKRIKAEQEARKGKKEVTLNDIYRNYNADSNLKDKLKSLELETEKQCLTPNPYMIDFFNYCVNHKDVYIISDMYLSGDFIKNILNSNGIVGYKKLYVSCEIGQTKSNGDLFETYLKQNNIASQEAIHIGDSWKADYLKPKEKGIASVHIPRILVNDSHVFSNKKISTNYLNSVINNNISSKHNNDSYYRFGFQKFGPFLWGYVRWIHKKLKEKNIKKVYFFSRDGFIMMKAFNALYKNEDIEVHYLEVSRRSLRVPILHFNHEFETIMNMVSPSKMVSLTSIFDCVGLDINNYKSLLNKYGFNKDNSFDRKNIFNDIKLRELYNELSDDIENKSINEYNVLIDYLRQENVKGKFGIVDIGWSGGMQRFLIETLNQLKIDNEIYGYYIGVASYYTRNTKIISNLNLNGYLFDYKNDKNAVDKRSSFVGLFESLFLEQSGSVENYTVSSKKIIAERAPYEYIIDGKETIELKAVRQIQKGALDFVTYTGQDKILSNLFSYSADELFQGLKSTGQNPQKEDLVLFSDFRFFDEGEINRLADPHNLFFYLRNPQKLKHDFLISRWKIGFMKKIFKVKLPYQKLYSWLLQFK